MREANSNEWAGPPAISGSANKRGEQNDGAICCSRRPPAAAAADKIYPPTTGNSAPLKGERERERGAPLRTAARDDEQTAVGLWRVNCQSLCRRSGWFARQFVGRNRTRGECSATNCLGRWIIFLANEQSLAAAAVRYRRLIQCEPPRAKQTHSIILMELLSSSVYSLPSFREVAAAAAAAAADSRWSQ